MLKKRLEKLEQQLEAVTNDEGCRSFEQILEALDNDKEIIIGEEFAAWLDEKIGGRE